MLNRIITQNRSAIRLLLSFIAAAVLVAAVFTSYGCSNSEYDEQQELALEEASQELQETTDLLYKLTSAISRNVISVEEVADEETYYNLQLVLEKSLDVLVPTSSSTSQKPADIVCDIPLGDVFYVENIIVELAQSQRAVFESAELKEAQDAFDQLQQVQEEAIALLEEVGEEVQDETVLDELSDVINTAQQSIDVGFFAEEVATYQDIIIAINESSEAVAASNEEYLEAKAAEEAAAAKAAAEAAAKSSSSNTSSSSGSGSSSSSSAQSSTWYVSYVSYTQSYLDAGYVCEWKTNYFIAHNWSSGGIKIASIPSYVVVNGITYKYVSSIKVTRDTTWGQVRDFVYENDGIGFQTCSGSLYLITHYEPV